MKRLMYTLLDLEREYRIRTCDFCTNHYGKDNKSVNQIITRCEVTNELIAVDVVCEICKEKFENDELPKCDKCGRLQTTSDMDIFSGKYNCDCEEKNLEEKELPALPERESMATFYERQINNLREEKEQLVEEVDTHLEALEVAEVWNKRQKQELFDKIAKLEKENGTYKEEVARLKEQLNSHQCIAQIETPSKEKGFKQFLKSVIPK